MTYQTYSSGMHSLHQRLIDDQEHLLILKKDAKILLHQRTSDLMREFLVLMRASGTEHERPVYQGLPDARTFALRLLRQRPLTFWKSEDAYKLKTGETGMGGFEQIGSVDEAPPLIIQDLLTYNEMAIAALLGVSTRTPFYNVGHRSNEGVRGVDGSFTSEGIYAGVVGARFERALVMEYSHMIVTPQQNTTANGYGSKASKGRTTDILRLWARFYQRPFLPDWPEAQKEIASYIQLPGCLFDADIYKQRVRMSIEPFLLDANERGALAPSGAYIVAVGIGLGVWAIHSLMQASLMLEVYQELLHAHELVNVAVLDFSWFPAEVQGNVTHNRIDICFSRRNPADRICANMLLVAMYAWDGNAYPGNEYWIGELSNSGDPAAACCSAIALLQNPDWNERLCFTDAVHFWPPLSGGDSVPPALVTSGASGCTNTDECVRLKFKEPSQTRYLHIDRLNVVHVFVPVVGGDEVSTDNTCKSAMEMQKFFGASFNVTCTKSSAAHLLQAYADMLGFDLWFVKECRIGNMSPDVSRMKKSRREQIAAYVSILHTLSRRETVRSQLQGAFPSFPSALAQSIQDSANIFTIVLSPKTPDSYLRFPAPSFELRRKPQLGGVSCSFRLALAEKLEARIPASRHRSPLAAAVFSGDTLRQESTVNSQSYLLMVERVVDFFAERGEQLPSLSFQTLDSLQNIMGITFDTMEETFDTFVSAESIVEPERSFFHTSTNQEHINIMVQAFLAIASIHLKAHCGYNRNFGQVCDDNALSCAERIHTLLFESDPEDCLLSWLTQLLERPLPPTVQKKVKERFNAFWLTVKDAPHYDEFLLLLHDIEGTGVYYQGCIGMHIGDCLAGVDDLPNTDKELVISAASMLERPSERRGILHNNNPFVEGSTISVRIQDLHEIIADSARSSSWQVAELLLMKLDENRNTVDACLYELLIRESSFWLAGRSDWHDIQTHMLALMPDQDSLDTFAQRMGHVNVWLRITTFVARSLYTEVTTSVPQGAEQLSGLSNSVTPSKLKTTLLLLGVDVPEEQISMSSRYDGYTVSLSQANRKIIMDIHERRRRNFHLSQESARLLYEECKRRIGANSPEYIDAMRYDNQTLSQVAHPADRSRTLRVPLKIFKTCLLLDIVIPYWEFNRFDGYLVSSDTASDIDFLEQTALWSRQQREMTNAEDRSSLAQVSHVRTRR